MCHYTLGGGNHGKDKADVGVAGLECNQVSIKCA